MLPKLDWRSTMAASLRGALTAALLLTAGCGTVENMRCCQEERQTFGGVKGDLRACKNAWKARENKGESWFPGITLVHYTRAVGTTCCRLIDLPFSAVGDYFTYPNCLSDDFWPQTPTGDWPDPNQKKKE